MAIAVRGTTSGGQSTSQNTTQSGNMNVPSGDLIVVAVRIPSGATVSGIVDSVGGGINTYVSTTNNNASTPNMQFWYAKNVTGSATFNVTVTYSTNVGFGDIFVWDIQNADITTPFDALSSKGSYSSALTGSCTITTVAAKTIILCAACTSATSHTFTAGGSFHLDGPFDATNKTSGAESLAFTSVQTSLSVSMSWTGSASGTISAISFKEAPIVAAPTFSPTPGAYGPAQSVTLSSTDSGLSGFAITYTTDGSTPVPGSHGTVYTVPISVSVTTTIKAIASATGYQNSTESDGTYTINGAVATPTFSPTPGTYTSTQSVTLSDTNSGLPGFAMTYTEDGSTPVPGSHGTVYSVPITVSVTETIKVIASATDYSNSAEADGTYTINLATGGVNEVQVGDAELGVAIGEYPHIGGEGY